MDGSLQRRWYERTQLSEATARRSLNEAKKEIRLLQLVPNNDHTIRFATQNVSLDPLSQSRPKYKALSYMCGTEPADQIVYVDGKHLHVRPNLHAFLKRLGTSDSEKWFHPGDFLWIDAICIDQENVVERNSQVALMSKIYSQAQLVLVWLGEKDQGGALRHAHIVEDSSAVTIYSRQEYWDRLWIVQEVLLSAKSILILGKENSSFDIFRDKAQGESQAHSLYMWRYLNRQASSPPFLIQALESFHRQQCSETKDKLFAILSLIRGGPDFPINYEDSVGIIFWKALQHFKGAYGTQHDDDSIAAGKLLRFAFQLTKIADPPERLTLSKQTPEATDSFVQFCTSTAAAVSQPSNNAFSKELFPVRVNILERDLFRYFHAFPEVCFCACKSPNLIQEFDHFLDPSKPVREKYIVCRTVSIDRGVLVFAIPSSPLDKRWRCVAFGQIRDPGGVKISLFLYPPPGLVEIKVEPKAVSRGHIVDIGPSAVAELLRYQMAPRKGRRRSWETHIPAKGGQGTVFRECGRAEKDCDQGLPRT